MFFSCTISKSDYSFTNSLLHFEQHANCRTVEILSTRNVGRVSLNCKLWKRREKMRTSSFISVSALALAASSAVAGTITTNATPNIRNTATTGSYVTRRGPEAILNVDVTGIESWDLFGDAD